MSAVQAVAARTAEASGRIVVRFTRSEADIAARVAMIRRVYEEFDDGLPYDEGMVRGFYERRVARPDQCVLHVELNGRMIGGLTGVIGPHFHSPALGASVVGFYVVREHRGSVAVVKLLHGFRRWARTNGAVRMYLSVTSGIEIARTDRMLKRLGFRAKGGNYELAL